MRGKLSRQWIAVAAFVVFLAASITAALPAAADRNHARNMTLDQRMMLTDFLGEFRVRVEEPRDEATLHVNLEVVAPWISNWSDWTAGTRHSLRLPRNETSSAILDAGPEQILFLSGGPWEESPLPGGPNSVFSVRYDNESRRVFCQSGNPAFFVTRAGVRCSNASLTIGSVMTVESFRDAMVRQHEMSQERHPERRQRVVQRLHGERGEP